MTADDHAAQGQYKNITLNDVQLAGAYYPLLVELAQHKHTLTYSELVTKAKQTYPTRPEVQRAIAVSTGRKLDVVRLFTNERGLPDLTSLVINKDSGECGSGFTSLFDPQAARKIVFEYDWTKATTDFDGYLRQTTAAITPRLTRTKQQALQAMADYYQRNKATLPKHIREKRELIIDLLTDGLSEEEAFRAAVSTSQNGSYLTASAVHSQSEDCASVFSPTPSPVGGAP